MGTPPPGLALSRALLRWRGAGQGGPGPCVPPALGALATFWCPAELSYPGSSQCPLVHRLPRGLLTLLLASPAASPPLPPNSALAESCSGGGVSRRPWEGTHTTSAAG